MQNDNENTKKTVPEPKRIERTLEVHLNQEERLKLGEELAEAQERIAQLQRSSSEVSKRFKADIAEQEARIGVLSNLIQTKRDYRLVPCHVYYDSPVPGQKQIVRLDTNAVIESAMMTEEEKQYVMDFDAKPDGEADSERVIEVDAEVVTPPVPMFGNGEDPDGDNEEEE